MYAAQIAVPTVTVVAMAVVMSVQLGDDISPTRVRAPLPSRFPTKIFWEAVFC